jgi:hypothetical protein
MPRRLIDLLAILAKSSTDTDAEIADFAHKLLVYVIRQIREATGRPYERLWDAARRLGEGLDLHSGFAVGYGIPDLSHYYRVFGDLDRAGFTADMLRTFAERYPAFEDFGSPAGDGRGSAGPADVHRRESRPR